MAVTAAALDLSCFAYLALPQKLDGTPRLMSTYPKEWTSHYHRTKTTKTTTKTTTKPTRTKTTTKTMIMNMKTTMKPTMMKTKNPLIKKY